jgi:23S rRNA pseudouridine1911/1915/1917 synthase
MNDLQFLIENDYNQRIDKFLAEKLNLSRSYIKYLIENNLVKVNNKIIKSSYILKKGDEIIISLKNKNTIYTNDKTFGNDLIYNKDQNFIKLIMENTKILYEDEEVIIIEKLPIVVNKVSKDSFSVIDYLLLKGIDPFIVHRLDRQTTGCLIVAKNYETALKLSELFKNRKVIKKYYAIVEGDFPYNSINIEGDIFSTKNPLKKEIISYGKKAITIVNKIKTIPYNDFLNLLKDKYEFEIINPYNNIKYFSLVNINILTGRTHQIRVHLSYLKYPIVGDYKYNSNFKFYLKLYINDVLYKLETFFLHSYYLELDKYKVISKPLWLDFIIF